MNVMNDAVDINEAGDCSFLLFVCKVTFFSRNNNM